MAHFVKICAVLNTKRETRKEKMKCKFCKCPVAVMYTTDDGVFCDVTCSELHEESELEAKLPVANAFLIVSHLNPVMD